MVQPSWDEALELTVLQMENNIRVQVALMSEEDRQRYAERYNTRTSSVEDILNNMLKVSRMHVRLRAASGQSDLFQRILSGKEPLKFPPPKRDGRAWYDTFDAPVGARTPALLDWASPSRRARDAGQNVWVVRINGCLWECRPEVLQGSQFLSAFQAGQWSHLHLLLKDQGVHLSLRYGRWPNEWSVEFLDDKCINLQQGVLTCHGHVLRLN